MNHSNFYSHVTFHCLFKHVLQRTTTSFLVLWIIGFYESQTAVCLVRQTRSFLRFVSLALDGVLVLSVPGKTAGGL